MYDGLRNAAPAGNRAGEEMSRLANKRTLITGATSGIGLETARQFSSEGARVAITGTAQSGLDSARRQLGDSVVTVVSDASDPASQLALAEAIRDTFGGLDVLVINAGIAELRPIGEWDEASFDRSVDTNFKGPFFLIQSLLPLLANPASIVLNASINAHIGMPNTSVYGASKAALLSLTRTLSGELAARGIRVNAISPGPIATPLYSKLGLSDQQARSMAEQLTAQVPAHRFGRPEEIAKAILFLASDEASFIVGSDLIIDGGLSL
jgi:NAD(P)-dependent dehydrogenase (short-subunit alcohol dehydrogenase family)